MEGEEIQPASQGKFDYSHARELQPFVRLSKCLLWSLQESSFPPNEKVFSAINTCSRARQYARLFLGYLRDGLALNAVQPINPQHPIYLLDLAAHKGHFGYLFLKELVPLLRGYGLQSLKIRYVMMESSSARLELLKENSLLSPYQESGILDFAIYPSLSAPALLLSKEVLESTQLVNPLILIANNFFSRLPQDLFKVREGVLLEGTVAITLEKKEPLAPEHSIIETLDYHYRYSPIKEFPAIEYYSQPEINFLLESYSQKFEGSTFLFPIGALQTLDYFNHLSKKRFFLIAGDSDVFCKEEEIKRWKEPLFSKDRPLSLEISYHAIAYFFRLMRGVGLLPNFSYPQFTVLVAVLGGLAEHYPETGIAFSDEVEAFDPLDKQKLTHYFEKNARDFSLEEILLLLKLNNWDPISFQSLFPYLRSQLFTASSALQQQLIQAIDSSYQQFYPLSSRDGEFVLNLAVLLFEMREYHRALSYFEKSIPLAGERATTYTNMGVCYHAIGQDQKAFECFQKSQRVSLESLEPPFS